MPRTNKRGGKRKPTLIMILLLAVICVGLFSVALWERSERKNEAERYEGESLYRPEPFKLEADGIMYRLRDGIECYLLIGLDKFSEPEKEIETVRNNQQADFLLLMVVDHENSSFMGLHLNRDTMTEIERYGLAGVRLKSMTAQLALAHTYGSGQRDSNRYTSNAVSKLLFGLPVQHYLSVTMDAIPVLNDLVGGVTVEIKDDFSHVDPSLVQGTEHRLVGEQALTYVRARGGMTDKTNLNRMERQRDYMRALYEQLLRSLNRDEDFALRFGAELSDYMVSDLTLEDLSGLAERLKTYRFAGIEDTVGEAKVGEEYMEFYPDSQALRAQVIRLFLTEV